MAPALGGDRLLQLRAAKLEALAAARGGFSGERAAYPSGAALLAGRRAWILDELPGPRSAGRVLVWALRHGVGELTWVLGGEQDPTAGLAAELARRVGCTDVAVSVLRIEGTALLDAPPSPVAAVEPPCEVTPDVVAEMAAAGVDLIVEGAAAHGEVLGLEVARVEPGTGVLEVGIGRFDREITGMLHAEMPGPDVLARAAGIVRDHRYPGAPPHPLQAMGRERWLRNVLVERPSLVGCRHLEPVATTVPLPNLRDPHPAATTGLTEDGDEVVVVCGVGVDPDLVPLAADTRASVAAASGRGPAEVGLMLVVPRGDLLGPLRDVGDHLAAPASWVEVLAPWVLHPAE